jgi:aminoglycoside 3-N-acetyltransferase
MITALVPRSVRRAVRGWLKRLHRTWGRARHGFDADALGSALARLGLAQGDVVLVHSSFDRFEGFTGKPTDLIAVLQRAIGPSGTLLMPTMPFNGSALTWAAEGATFDVRRTPSRMGLLTELFRRSPGVVRSVHPTHPVAAWGARADTLTADHYLATTPCGAGSPFARLLEHDGKVLLAGTGIGVLTLFHTIEEILEPEMPFSPFTAEKFTLASRDGEGRIVTSTMRLFNPERSRQRNLDRLVPALKARGAWRERRVGTVDLVLLDATEILDACRMLAKNGLYCYDD